jgi:hypothetical protein
MPLVFLTLNKPKNVEALNEEWMLLENTGPNVINANGCALTVAKNGHERPHPIGTLDPGFILQPNEKIRLVTGSPAKKAQGEAPEEKNVKNYHLFLREPVLARAGQVLRLQLKQAELARAVFAPDQKTGIAKE